MGQYVAKQPNGKYCIFSTIVDTIVGYDLTKEQVVEFFIDEETEIIIRKAEQAIKRAKNFEQVIEDFSTLNEIQEEFEEWCKSVGWREV